MRKVSVWLSLLLAVGLCAGAGAQSRVNPNSQVNWPQATGSGAPTATCQATYTGPGTVAYGTPYTDVTNNVYYVCTAAGWEGPVAKSTSNPADGCATWTSGTLGSTGIACGSGGGGGGSTYQINGVTQVSVNGNGALPMKCADSSGSGTTQSCFTTPTFTISAGNCLTYTTLTPNSGSSLTIAINGGSGLPVAIPSASGWTTTLTTSIIPANKPLELCYDGTNLNVQQTGTVSSGMVFPAAGVPQSTGGAWGTSLQVGTSANDLIQLDGSARIPAVSGALLTNLPSISINGTTCTPGSSCTPSAPPSGAAGGDLSGTYPNPTVAKVNGNALPVSKTIVGTDAGGHIVDATTATLPNSISGNAATASGLAGTPSICGSGSAAEGILANGNATGCTTISGTVTYTTSTTASVSDSGKVVIMNCASACSYTLPNPQPSVTWAVRLKSVGSSVATVALGSSMTYNGGAAVPALLSYQELHISANTGTATDYSGQTPLVAGANVTITPSSNGQTVAASGGGVPAVPVVIDTSTPVTVSTTNNAEYHFNENATAATAVTYNLPTAAAGKQFCFSNGNNGTAADTGVLTLQTSATGQFIVFTDGTLSATDGNVTSGGAAADAACVVGVDSTHWMLYVERGTWTKH